MAAPVLRPGSALLPEGTCRSWCCSGSGSVLGLGVACAWPVKLSKKLTIAFLHAHRHGAEASTRCSLIRAIRMMDEPHFLHVTR